MTIQNKLTLDKIYSFFNEFFDLRTRLILYRHINKLVFLEKENDWLRTLAVDYKGNLYISKEFWEEHLESESTGLFAFSILLHELCHLILRDTKDLKIEGVSEREHQLIQLAKNIAMDMRINSFILSQLDNSGNLLPTQIQCSPEENSFIHSYVVNKSVTFTIDNVFTAIYTKALAKNMPSDPFIFLLLFKYDPIITENTVKTFIVQNETHLRKKELKRQLLDIHKKLYNQDRISDYRAIYTLVYEYLKILDKENTINIEEIEGILIGDHSEDNNNNLSSKEIEQIKVNKKEITDAIKSKLGNKGSKEEKEFLFSSVESSDRLDLSSLRDIMFFSAYNNIKAAEAEHRWLVRKTPVFPTKLLKRDIMELARNRIPALWRMRSKASNAKSITLPLYVDVSGSMFEEIPRIVKLLLHMEYNLDYMWTFSTYIHKCTRNDLAAHKFNSSGGTDFKCVVDHALEQNYKNFIVITDGYDGRSTDSYGPKLEFNKIITLLTTEHSEDNIFCKTSPDQVYKLNELVK